MIIRTIEYMGAQIQQLKDEIIASRKMKMNSHSRNFKNLIKHEQNS